MYCLKINIIHCKKYLGCLTQWKIPYKHPTKLLSNLLTKNPLKLKFSSKSKINSSISIIQLLKKNSIKLLKKIKISKKNLTKTKEKSNSFSEFLKNTPFLKNLNQPNPVIPKELSVN